MRILCKACGRNMPLPKDTVHFVCHCKDTLMFFGEQKNCEIFKHAPRKHAQPKPKGNLNYMIIEEKRQYFREKYPLKQ